MAQSINLANILQNVESIKSARATNEMNALRLQEAKKRIGYMDTDRDFEMSERQNMLNNRTASAEAARQEGALRGQVASGDQAALRQFIALKPDEGKKILDAFAQMDENQKKQAGEQVDMMGRMAAYVLNAENPEEAYARVKKNVGADAAKEMPEKYDRNFVTMQLARAREIEDLLKPQENPQVATFGAEDVMMQGGKVIDRTESNALLRGQQTANNKASEEGGIKTADESLMYRQAAQLLGGLLDQQGNLQNLDPNTRANVQAITTEATRLLQAGEASNNSDAVAKAARKLNISISDLSGSNVSTAPVRRTYNPQTGTFQ